jgi:hypothetical protein
LLGALAADPGQSAAALLPKAAAANSAVFFEPSGAPRSVGAVMTLIQTRMDAALQGGGQDVSAPDPGNFATTGDLGGLGSLAVTPPEPGPIAQQFSEAQASGDATTGVGAGDGTSMAETLRSTFGLAAEGTDSGAAPAFVRSAYGRMRALGL